MEWSAKSPDVWQVEKYSILNTNSRQETKKKIQQLSRKKNPSGLTKIKGSGQRWRKKP